jgi:hypothetical protein
MNTYAGPERREHVQLTEDQIDQIATRAATKAVEMMTASAYQEVGKRTVKGLLYIVGVLSVMALGWLTAHEKIKF